MAHTQTKIRYRRTPEQELEAALSASGGKRVPPDPGRLLHALRAIGYSTEQAAADIIDNSIAAHASAVLIRIEKREDDLRRVVIVDNGKGMSEATLEKAMQFGVDMQQGPESLNKYGMGMKLASLSQGEELVVLTMKGDRSFGRGWNVEGIGDQWRCDPVVAEDIRREFRRNWRPLQLKSNGTLVIWRRLDQIPMSKGGIDRTIDRLLTRLRQHLGLHFHRFIENKKLDIHLDVWGDGEPKLGEPIRVPALNPFKYQPEPSGDPDYPKVFVAELPGRGRLHLKAHVWPPRSESAQYKLDGKAAQRQGLYFYRNNRLIQAGGWNDGKDSTEPHSSLARVSVELPAELDTCFRLDVKKSGLREPADFAEALGKATAPDGTTFTQYRRAAEHVYRRAARSDPANKPLAPGLGIRASLRRRLQRIIAPDQKRVRCVTFRWTDIDDGNVFEIDRDACCVKLNRKYRRRLLGKSAASGADLPLLKVLLFFLVEETIDTGRMSQQQRDKLVRLDLALLECVKSLQEE